MSASVEQIANAPTAEEQLASTTNTLCAVKGNVSNMRHARDYFNKQRDKLFNIIIRTAGEDGIREAYKEINNSVQFPYYALKGKYTTKKGKETDCWKSAYGKYAGKWEEGKPAPILNGYLSYSHFKEEDLLWDAETKKFFVHYPHIYELDLDDTKVQLAYTKEETKKIAELFQAKTGKQKIYKVDDPRRKLAVFLQMETNEEPPALLEPVNEVVEETKAPEEPPKKKPRTKKQTIPKLTFLEGEDNGKCGKGKSKDNIIFPFFLMGCCGQVEGLTQRVQVPCKKLDYDFFKRVADDLKRFPMFDWDWDSFTKNILAPNKEHLKIVLNIDDEAADRFLRDGYVFINNFDKQPADEDGEGANEEWEEMRLKGEVGYFCNFQNFLEHPNELEY